MDNEKNKKGNIFSFFRLKDFYFYQVIPAIVSIFFLLMALLEASTIKGFYTLVKIIVCLSSVYYAYLSYKSKNYFWFWFFVFMAIIFNFAVPIDFSYRKYISYRKYNRGYYRTDTYWPLINTISAVAFFLFSALNIRRNKNN